MKVVSALRTQRVCGSCEFYQHYADCKVAYPGEGVTLPEHTPACSSWVLAECLVPVQYNTSKLTCSDCSNYTMPESGSRYGSCFYAPRSPMACGARYCMAQQDRDKLEG